jgi:hypothetical protein
MKLKTLNRFSKIFKISNAFNWAPNPQPLYKNLGTDGIYSRTPYQSS